MTAEFIEIPPLEISTNGNWLLHKDLVYQSRLREEVITVPEGFETDLASIPRVFTPVIPKNGRHRPAAIVHDYLCREKIGPRRTADRIFLEAMKVSGVWAWRRYAMYLAVSITTTFIRKKP